MVTPAIPLSLAPREPLPSKSSKTAPEIVPWVMSAKLAIAEPPLAMVTDFVLAVMLAYPSGSVSSTV